MQKQVLNSDPKEGPNPTNFSNLRSQNYLSMEKENSSSLYNNLCKKQCHPRSADCNCIDCSLEVSKFEQNNLKCDKNKTDSLYEDSTSTYREPLVLPSQTFQNVFSQATFDSEG